MVNFVFRKDNGGKSIEMLFLCIQTKLSRSYNNHTLKYGSNTIGSMLKNMIDVSELKDICHVTGDVHYVSINPFQKNILTIHDVKSILTGNSYAVFVKKIFWFYLPALFVTRITVISNFSREELLRIIPFARRKIGVIYNPVNPKFEKKPKLKFEKKILHIGTKKNKNLTNTILGLKGLDCILYIVGDLSREHIEILNCTKVNYVNFVNVSLEKIKNLYEECDVVSFISTYEGFGMPIVEAQKVGRVVITSKCGAIPEIGSDSVHYVDPYDIDSIRDGFIHVFSDESYREELITKGYKNIIRFDLQKIIKDYEELYNCI